MAEPLNDKGRRVSLELREDTIERLDALRKQWSLRSRGAAIQRLLDDLLQDLPAEHDVESEQDPQPEDHLQGAIVLVSSTNETPEPEPEERSTGINLPGFVSRRTTKLKRSLKEPVVSEAQASGERFEVMDDQQLSASIAAVQNQWMSLYGSEPSAAVLEAAMNWLGQDIWPSADASEGQSFTWNAVQQVMLGFCPSWEIREASVDRVVVAAGVLEDPFGAASLPMRVPSLVGRMTQRLRRRRRGSPFLDLQSTMSTQGSLKLLGLSTAPGFKLSLSDIREAYRQKALACHPDAGGSAEDMRRLNEAYQLLKQRYVRTN
ncbi:MAG: DnaJ domain-containing protein [Prochlorococcaceae cyanobacterium]|nr:DnaJ domain-containing protein [Cyanobacteriota bacterium]MEC8608605.1 DnaJ domain-containing protein [Cyanobacteriota bacterium]RCL62360.1 MAG: J domain-containing protein [Synechococcus sp. MED-G67]HCA60957.1 J domain-containing protein [Synechococcales bacterium UBA8647]